MALGDSFAADFNVGEPMPAILKVGNSDPGTALKAPTPADDKALAANAPKAPTPAGEKRLAESAPSAPMPATLIRDAASGDRAPTPVVTRLLAALALKLPVPPIVNVGFTPPKVGNNSSPSGVRPSGLSPSMAYPGQLEVTSIACTACHVEAAAISAAMAIVFWSTVLRQIAKSLRSANVWALLSERHVPVASLNT